MGSLFCPLQSTNQMYTTIKKESGNEDKPGKKMSSRSIPMATRPNDHCHVFASRAFANLEICGPRRKPSILSTRVSSWQFLKPSSVVEGGDHFPSRQQSQAALSFYCGTINFISVQPLIWRLVWLSRPHCAAKSLTGQLSLTEFQVSFAEFCELVREEWVRGVGAWVGGWGVAFCWVVGESSHRSVPLGERRGPA